jgi:hypothetical protein
MTNHTLIPVLEKAWKGGIALQSNFFRDSPKLVALAASLGLITSIDSDVTYGAVWRVTPEGCYQLFEHFKEQETTYEYTNLTGDPMDTEDPTSSIATDNSRLISPLPEQFFTIQTDF